MQHTRYEKVLHYAELHSKNHRAYGESGVRFSTLRNFIGDQKIQRKNEQAFWKKKDREVQTTMYKINEPQGYIYLLYSTGTIANIYNNLKQSIYSL